MNLYIDVGNTATKFAIDEKQEIKPILTIDTSKIEEDVDGALRILNVTDLDGVYVSSVVPAVNKLLQGYFLRKYNLDIYLISPEDESGVKIDIDDKNELGSDLLCDLAGAKALFNYPLLVIDLGTATKFLFIDNKGVFFTCAIIQGLELSLHNLSKNTALLPMLDFDEVKPLLENKNTKDVLVSSAYYSHVDMINGMVARYKKEVGYPFKVVLTGGNITKIAKDLNFKYEIKNNLCLEGIKVIINMKKGF